MISKIYTSNIVLFKSGDRKNKSKKSIQSQVDNQLLYMKVKVNRKNRDLVKRSLK